MSTLTPQPSPLAPGASPAERAASWPARLRRIRRRRCSGSAEMVTLDRSARTPVLIDGPADLAGRLRGLRVMVVGTGSIGLALAEGLARLNVGELILVDRGVIKPESVLTHPVHPSEIGRSKASLAGERAKAINPTIEVKVHDGAVQDLSLADFAGLSVVAVCSDNVQCEVDVAGICRRLGLRLVQAAVHGPSLVASVRTLTNRPDGPCLACSFLEGDWRAYDEKTLFSCSGIDSRPGVPAPSAVPTVSPAGLCAIAANMAQLELVGLVADLDGHGGDRVIEYCAYGPRVLTTELELRADCRGEHERWQVVEAAGRFAAHDLRRLSELAGVDVEAELEEGSLEVEGSCFTRVGTCGCEVHPVIGRFQPLDPEAARCLDCSQPLVAHPFYTHTEVPGRVLRDHLDVPLGVLGAPGARALIVRSPGGVALVHAPLPAPPSRTPEA